MHYLDIAVCNMYLKPGHAHLLTLDILSMRMELFFKAVLNAVPATSQMIYASSFKGLKSAEEHERASA